MKLVFATNNQHKLEEARQIAADGIEILSLSDIGCHESIPEDYDTIEENSLQKARYIRDKYGYACFSDDTGLFVDALGGAPGVYSARYAGPDCSPADNIAKLLAELRGVANRKACFRTVATLCDDNGDIQVEGRVDGEIATDEAGTEGFGYDPIFIASETGTRFAEMSADQKNAISHRGRALRKLFDFLRK